MNTIEIRTVLFVFSTVTALTAGKINPYLSDNFINEINKESKTWEAGRNFNPHTSMKFLKRLVGVLPDHENGILPVKGYSTHDLQNLSEEFDARKAWPECPVIREIRDQGACGSCWAVSTAAVISDRTCIQTNGNVQFRYSAQDLVSCCKDCGFGCQGGYPNSALKYWEQVGVVSGGPYNSSQGCLPYQIAPCEHHVEGYRPNCEDVIIYTPRCKHECSANYGVDYAQDKHRASDTYKIYGEQNYMRDIMNFGPLLSSFSVYSDFYSYKSGVYHHTSGSHIGTHAVKVLGWGIENGVKYWLCANSWNTDWGDNGYFKILRGSNECNIELAMLGGKYEI